MKPRWKLIVELIFGWVWLLGINAWWAYYHSDDPGPWNVIWWLVALGNTFAAFDLIRNAWREL